MVGFVKKKLKSYTLGEKLKSIREGAQVPLAEIAKNTKIREDYLKKIEGGSFDELPSDVYVKGFLRNYSKYLGIDAEDVVKQYEKERGIQNNLKKLQLPKKKRQFNFPSITITPKVLTTLLLILLVGCGVFYFYRQVGKFSENPRLVIFQPVSDMTVNASSLEVAGVTDKDCKVSINGQPIFVNEAGEFNEDLGLQKGSNSILVKAINKFGKESEKTYNISADYERVVKKEDPEAVVAGTEDEVKVNDKVRVEVKVEELPVWISVRVDDKKAYSGTMLPGSIQNFEGDDQILVTSGKANKTFIKFNGEDIGILADSPGVVREVIFTKETKIMPQEEVAASDDNEEQEDEDKKDKKN